jgi:Domain of unknown function (DUF4190)
MTHNGTHSVPVDPLSGATYHTSPSELGPAIPHAPAPPEHATRTLATLSIVFAFVFAPVGAILGHLALSQINSGRQQGRDRALVGVTLSYIFILFAVTGLVLSEMTEHVGSSSTVVNTVTGAVPTVAPLVPDMQTTVITPAPLVRRTVKVIDLRPSDCVEIQQSRPDPNKADTRLINIYPVNCQARDGVFQVNVISSSTNPCADGFLVNRANTVVACISKFKGLMTDASR